MSFPTIHKETIDIIDILYRSGSNLTFEEQLCKILLEGDSRKLEDFFDIGFNPDYVLKNDIQVKSEIFLKGSSLLFLVIFCSTKREDFWNYCAALDMLLQQGANIENSPGGGYTSVLDYICANEDLVFESIIVLLLRAIPQDKALAVLEKILNPQRKESLMKEVFPILLSSLEKPSPTLTSPVLSPYFSKPFCYEETPPILSPCYFSCEKKLASSLYNRDEEDLRSLLDSGLSPNFCFTETLVIGNFTFFKGMSLLLAALKISIENQSSENFIGVISLLLERGVDLNQESLGVLPLIYMCKNEEKLNENLVLCLLTSVSEKKALQILKCVEDENRRKKLEDKLKSSEQFQFSSVDSVLNKSMILSSKDLEDPLEGTSSSFYAGRKRPLPEGDPLSNSYFYNIVTSSFIQSSQFCYDVCAIIMKGDEFSLRSLLEQGLSPNYCVEIDVILDTGIIPTGTPLLVIILLAMALENNLNSSKTLNLVSMIVLLFEKGVSLTQDVFGKSSLDIACENASFIPKSVLLALLRSVNIEIAKHSLLNISNLAFRVELERALNSNEDILRFDNEVEVEVEDVLNPINNRDRANSPIFVPRVALGDDESSIASDNSDFFNLLLEEDSEDSGYASEYN